MSQTEYLHGVQGYDVDEEEEEEYDEDGEEEEEEEADKGNVEGDVEKVEKGDFEEREEEDDDEEGLGISVVSIGYDYQADISPGIGNETFDDDNCLLEDENNNNADLRTEDVEEMSDSNKENEPIQNTPVGFLKRRKTGVNVTTPAKKSKTTDPTKTSNDTTSGKKSKAKDPRKDLPTLVAGTAPQSRNAFAAAFAESSATKIKAYASRKPFQGHDLAYLTPSFLIWPANPLMSDRHESSGHSLRVLVESANRESNWVAAELVNKGHKALPRRPEGRSKLAWLKGCVFVEKKVIISTTKGSFMYKSKSREDFMKIDKLFYCVIIVIEMCQ
ncbi:hypothetical protein BG003_010755 [Podila horticola]|nr:hypothetical protein BG003_010755 [Podila horticola]